ncbi:REP-associated tyrosine transposase [Stutzerimonas stutzeri]|uniref:REP-associated tyrosine transposase n=1 Tax=Stutzerimonas stutzeri TaxID=316 RepID=UPI0015E2914A|nr:transposase [Stutzerimonas stutzeri]MBA1264601.1 transposase [Stutzerimonas stutzeri]
MRYRRMRTPGASYFFTVVTQNRRLLLACAENVELLREAFRVVQRQRPFVLEAAVVLPDHLHCIWTLPEGDADYPTRWRLIKSRFTRRYTERLLRDPDFARHACGQGSIWQQRYWEHCLRDEEDRRRHLDYLHYNPVKHGLVTHPADWPYSSFARHVAKGFYPADWAG